MLRPTVRRDVLRCTRSSGAYSFAMPLLSAWCFLFAATSRIAVRASRALSARYAGLTLASVRAHHLTSRLQLGRELYDSRYRRIRVVVARHTVVSVRPSLLGFLQPYRRASRGRMHGQINHGFPARQHDPIACGRRCCMRGVRVPVRASPSRRGSPMDCTGRCDVSRNRAPVRTPTISPSGTIRRNRTVPFVVLSRVVGSIDSPTSALSFRPFGFSPDKTVSFEKWSISTITYLLPLFDLGSAPYISIDTI